MSKENEFETEKYVFGFSQLEKIVRIKVATFERRGFTDEDISELEEFLADMGKWEVFIKVGRSLLEELGIKPKSEKEPEKGSLSITTEYEGMPEENVECWLYESYFKFQKQEYLQKELSDEFGEVFFDNIEAGWYIVEARKIESSMFTLWAADSVEIEAGRRTNKILILWPQEK